MVALVSCNNDGNSGEKTTQTQKADVVAPAISGDSAYYFVKAQCDFGPRVPGTPAHQQCAEWMVATLKDYADTVYTQDFKAQLYDGKMMDGTNIIATFNPKAQKRIIVAAHWDSRPYADNDPDEKNWHTPIDGANDGASGCGIMMEMARVMKTHRIADRIGIDLIFFDLEDYGTPKWIKRDLQENDMSWGLGSQYWAQKPHISGYSAKFGMLLDMVGAANPHFPREIYSHYYAEWVVNKVWNRAGKLGYGNYFTNEEGNPINDDHVYIMQYANIPTIDIIHLVDADENESCFYPYWHTVNDNISQIKPKTLQMVGNVVMNVIYNE